MKKIYGNRFCEIFETPDGYIIHSKLNMYPDKLCATIKDVVHQTHIPMTDILQYLRPAYE